MPSILVLSHEMSCSALGIGVVLTKDMSWSALGIMVVLTNERSCSTLEVVVVLSHEMGCSAWGMFYWHVSLVVTRCVPAKDYFKDLSGHWSWAVQWLQKKVSLQSSTEITLLIQDNWELSLWMWPWPCLWRCVCVCPPRCPNITGLLRATCPTRRPPTRPSSVLSQHR
jgi:hypothetical protein